MNRRDIAVAARWLHVYLSMISFALVFFFAATGLTLNHPGWGASHATTAVTHGQVELAKARGADRLWLVEWLRAHAHVHGAVTDFRADDGPTDQGQVAISFRAPGYTADAFVDRATGRYDLTEVRSGWLAVVNDLHKGQDAGRAWAVVIDASAVFLLLVSATGLVLIWFMTKRRASGLMLAGLALGAVLLLWRFAVP